MAVAAVWALEPAGIEAATRMHRAQAASIAGEGEGESEDVEWGIFGEGEEEIMAGRGPG